MSLLDGPSLLLIAIGMLALDRGRPWIAAVTFGISGLGRETNLLTPAAQIDPAARGVRSIVQQLLQVVVIVLPVAVWFDYLYSIYRGTLYTSGHVLAAPLSWYWWRWRMTLSGLQNDGWQSSHVFTLIIVVSLTVQALFMFLRPRWRSAWWRLGVSYAALMLLFGRPLWEGIPGGLRVVLPLTLAFNVLLLDVRQGRWFWPLWVAGNLSVAYGLSLVPPPFAGGWL
jgi:hypothetical protein